MVLVLQAQLVNLLSEQFSVAKIQFRFSTIIWPTVLPKLFLFHLIAFHAC